jgi:hypothetical protein
MEIQEDIRNYFSQNSEEFGWDSCGYFWNSILELYRCTSLFASFCGETDSTFHGIFFRLYESMENQNSSVGVETGYGLDGRD